MAGYDYNTNTFSLSVRDITDFVFRDGDVSGEGFASEEKMLAGARFHRSYENKMEKKGFVSEHRMECIHEYDDGLKLVITGIADLVKWDVPAKKAFVGEIKTVSKDVKSLAFDSIPKYMAQSLFYAFMFMHERETDSCSVSLIFHNLSSGTTNEISEAVGFERAQTFFEETLGKLYKWLKLFLDHRESRNFSVKRLEFPYGTYRKGQRELCAAVFRSIRDGEKLFAEAPTGTGKTMSTLFPAVKAMGEGHIRKVFYLTAKVITRKVAKDAVLDMANGTGLDLNTIVLSAKSRSCIGGGNCLPHLCKYSSGHGERVNAALFELVSTNKLITPELIEEYAVKYTVCPHELGLDASLFCDIVIGDYNHAYDPRAMLQRYFSSGGEYALLVDEAHNLPDRAREMYSSCLGLKMIKEAAKQLKGVDKLKKLRSAFSKVATEIGKTGKGIEQGQLEDGKAVVKLSSGLETALTHLCEQYRKLLADEQFAEQKEKTVEAYFECKFFLSLIDYCSIYKNSFATYFNCFGKSGEICIVCTDPSPLLYDLSKLSSSTVFFSATLRPFDYFYDILGGSRLEAKDDVNCVCGDDTCNEHVNSENLIKHGVFGEYTDKYIRIGSPFPRKNLLCLAVCGISTRYKDRKASYERIAATIMSAISAKTGNYMVFFPSFSYLENVHEHFDALCEDHPEIRSICQTAEMTELERAEFLSGFEDYGKQTLVGFCVCGGVFSEGVDLKGERLSGAIIVGTGMPGVCFERNLLRKSYDAMGQDGFDFAYTFPGLNRVFQAGGRVIRTENDRGFVLLIDDRYRYTKYTSSFPEAWSDMRYFSSESKIEKIIGNFFAE